MSDIHNHLLSYLETSTKKGQLPVWENIYQTLLEWEYEQNSIEFAKTWFKKIDSFSPITTLLEENPLATEIIFHGPNEIQIDGPDGLKPFSFDYYQSNEWQVILELLSIKNEQIWNYSHPFCSFYMQLGPYHLRATLLHFACTPKKTSKLFLRKMASKDKCSQFDFGLPLECLKNKITGKKNILISGSTGSGKTSLLKATFQFIPSEEHVVILEDTHELNTENTNWTYLLNKNEDALGLKSFCSYAMRIRPDRMILGEMRSHEVVPFLLSMNTGHRGLMSTVHADSARDALSRVALLFSLYQDGQDMNFGLVLKMICQSIDYVIHLESGKVRQAIAVLGSNGEVPFIEEIDLSLV